jgi:3-methyladenine DNA glycosylase Mpg
VKKETKKLQDLANGPSKQCIAIHIKKSLLNQMDLANCDSLWLQDSIFEEDWKENNFKIVKSKRIDIQYVEEEAINQLYSFYIKSNILIILKSKEEI